MKNCELIDIATVKTKRSKGHGITIVVKLLGTTGYDTRPNFLIVLKKKFFTCPINMITQNHGWPNRLTTMVKIGYHLPRPKNLRNLGKSFYYVHAIDRKHGTITVRNKAGIILKKHYPISTVRKWGGK